MIIFEGIDGAGKTSRALAVVKLLAERGLLMGFQRYGVLPADWDYLRDYWGSLRRYNVVDRFLWSEHVYGPVARGGVNAALNAQRQATLAREMARIGTLTVLVRCEVEEALSRRKKGDEFTEKVIRAAHKRYAETSVDVEACGTAYADLSRCLVLNTSTRGPNCVGADALDIVELYGELQFDTAWYDQLKLDGTGPLRHATHVFVAEQQNTHLGAYANRAMVEGSASEALHLIMESAGIDQRRVHIVNAIQRDGRLLPIEGLNFAIQQRIPIIACGNVAEERLTQLGVSHIKMAHPQYLKRFKPENLIEEATCLRDKLSALIS